MRKLQYPKVWTIVLVLICGSLAVAWAEDPPKININTASAEELIQLKGIGTKKAASIIEFRENTGPFKQPEDLIKVHGIGPKTLEDNRYRITVE